MTTIHNKGRFLFSIEPKYCYYPNKLNDIKPCICKTAAWGVIQ